MILLDTHALVWWAVAPTKLSARAATVLAQMEEVGGYASAISVWEIEAKVRTKKLELPITIDELVARCEREAIVRLLPVDAKTWLRTARLDWEHRDPADRVIVATAAIEGLRVLTKDTAMQQQSIVECVW